MSKGPETRLVAKIRGALEEEFPGTYWRKIHGNPFQHAGIPDLIGCVDGFFIGLEVKTDSGRSSMIQKLEGEAIIKAGGIHGVVRSPEDAIILIKFSLKALRVKFCRRCGKILDESRRHKLCSECVVARRKRINEAIYQAMEPIQKSVEQTKIHPRPELEHSVNVMYHKEARRWILENRPGPWHCDICSNLIERLGVRPQDGNVHHIDGDPTNNDPENLVVRCKTCHLVCHGLEDRLRLKYERKMKKLKRKSRIGNPA